MRGKIKMVKKNITGYSSIDKPWLKYYDLKLEVKEPIPEESVYAYVYKCNRKYMNDPAICYFGRTYSFGDLFNEVERVAGAFLNRGVKPGDIVTIILPNIPEAIICFYALNKIGAVSNFINILSAPEEITSYILDAQSSVVVVLDSFLNKICCDVKHIIVIATMNSANIFHKLLLRPKKIKLSKNVVWYHTFISNSRLVSNWNGKSDDFAVMVHTSGTTGKAKGVMLSNQNFNILAYQYKTGHLNFSRREKFLSNLPPFIVYGLGVASHSALCAGLTLIMHPLYDPQKFFNNVCKYKPNHLVGGAPDIENMISHSTSKVDLSFIKTIAVGGDFINKTTEYTINKYLHEHGCSKVLVKGYGMSELCATVITSFQDRVKLQSVGIPFSQVNIKINDLESGCEKTYGEIGEICIHSPSCMLGYYKNSALSEEIVEYDELGRKWLHTGDLGYITEDGFVFIKGRLKRVYPTSRGKFYPVTIENVIKELPLVQNCVVVACTDPAVINYPVAFVKLSGENSGSHTDMSSMIKRKCASSLSSHMVPRKVIFVNDFPVTSTGKLDYRALEQKAERRNIYPKSI